jgi:hypothetical protein
VYKMCACTRERETHDVNEQSFKEDMKPSHLAVKQGVGHSV